MQISSSRGTRRQALAGFAAGGAALSFAGLAGCAAPVVSGTGSAPEVFVGLARERAIAVLDPVTDTVGARISIETLGTHGRPWQMLVGPRGMAAILPLTTAAEPEIGLIAPTVSAGTAGTAGTASTGSSDGLRRTLMRRCSWMGVGEKRPRANPVAATSGEVAQGLAADDRGMAYVLVADQFGGKPPYAAVVDLSRSTVVQHIPLAKPGEAVFALAAEPEGTCLYAAVWRWDEAGGHSGQGRIVALDPTTGAIRAQYRLPEESVATDLALSPPPGGGAARGVFGSPVSSGSAPVRALYAVTATPGPSVGDDDWWAPGTQFGLMHLDAARLNPLADWRLDRQPSAVAVTPDGRRAYLLVGPSFGVPWTRQLVGLDLVSGAVAGQWPLPEGCLALAASSVGKVYVADTMGDRLWRVDTRTDTFLGSIPMPGAPLALSARQG